MTRHLTRRDFLKAASAAASAVVLAACQPSAAPPTEPTVQQPEPTKVPAKVDPTATLKPTEVTVQQPAATEKVKVDFINMWGDAREPLMNKVIEEFEALNPDIDIENLVQSWDNRDERMAALMAGSNPPALMMSSRVETYKYAKEDLIVPIDDYVSASGLDLNEIFYESEIENQRWSGKLWALPMPTAGGNSSMYFYNKKMMAEAGMDAENGLTTWQEMEQFAGKLTTFKGDAIDVLGVDPVGGWAERPNWGGGFVLWLLTNNGQLSTPDGKTIIFNGAEGLETLEWLVNFMDEYLGGVENSIDFWKGTKDSDPGFPLYNDRLGIHFGNVAQFGHLLAQDPDMYNDPSQWGVGYRPYNATNPNAKSLGETGLSFSWGYVIHKSLPKEKQDAAYKFLEFMATDEKGGCAFLLAQGRPTPVKKCNDNPEYPAANPYWDKVKEALGHDVSVTVTPVQGQINSELTDYVEKALYGAEKPKDALEQCAAACQKILDEYWKG